MAIAAPSSNVFRIVFYLCGSDIEFSVVHFQFSSILFVRTISLCSLLKASIYLSIVNESCTCLLSITVVCGVSACPCSFDYFRLEHIVEFIRFTDLMCKHLSFSLSSLDNQQESFNYYANKIIKYRTFIDKIISILGCAYVEAWTHTLLRAC